MRLILTIGLDQKNEYLITDPATGQIKAESSGLPGVLVGHKRGIPADGHNGTSPVIPEEPSNWPVQSHKCNIEFWNSGKWIFV